MVEKGVEAKLSGEGQTVDLVNHGKQNPHLGYTSEEEYLWARLVHIM